MKINLELNPIIDFYLLQKASLGSILQTISICNSAGLDMLSLTLDKNLNEKLTMDELKLIRYNIGDTLALHIPMEDAFIKQAIMLRPDILIFHDINMDHKETQGIEEINLEKIEESFLNLDANNIPVGVFVKANKEVLKRLNKTSLDWIEIEACNYTDAEDSNDEIQGLEDIINFVEMAKKMGFGTSLKGGISFKDISVLKKINYLDELCIGWDFWELALKIGIQKAVTQITLKLLK